MPFIIDGIAFILSVMIVFLVDFRRMRTGCGVWYASPEYLLESPTKPRNDKIKQTL